jgi:hypothetical protein
MGAVRCRVPRTASGVVPSSVAPPARRRPALTRIPYASLAENRRQPFFFSRDKISPDRYDLGVAWWVICINYEGRLKTEENFGEKPYFLY